MIRSFDGKTPQIAVTAYIDETAVIIGDVEIGEESSVWPGAVIRGDMGKITIGKQSVIEDNCVIHSGIPGEDDSPVSIGDRVTIGHGAVVHSISIGSHVLIGINATLLHRSIIGDFCVIAAATLVGPGQEIPDNSLAMGVPAKIKGKPSESQFWWSKNSFEKYKNSAKKIAGL
ncbi:gamma carbonic anhydrase family protein [Desulfobacula phenolica]|uniref:Carbonic anhydrase or acetyltransferase, isoleucine patch superfamily n=1 Tax=Desulfobacula phenolica TaxID=90732 RepID=A0A1H2IVD2_9BACT|nr:gamma carbonic anhydrase family protein [Desulfobacula phenolica]SDU47778.1 Carbonic anhydrase or acetyltransferase, isoleucine patch superfamily [Desulfobacula phenolica]